MSNTSPQWRSASASDGMQCVELAAIDGGVSVRDSKDPDGPTLNFTKGELAAFADGITAGEFADLYA